MTRLRDLLASSTWKRRIDPFPHFYVEQVFISEAYEQIESAFRKLLCGRGDRQSTADEMSYYGGTFGAYLTPFKATLRGPLSLFISRAWIDLLARLTNVPTTLDINGAFHYHEVGSRDGFVHKDFSSCWFPRSDGDVLNIADNRTCDYRSGKASAPGIVTEERVRAVAILYYLNNAPWSPGDGGETGLYRRVTDPVAKPALRIPPINNSMLVFECSPSSYHSFISNRCNGRSSVVMWLHCTKADAVKKWGANSVVYVQP